MNYKARRSYIILGGTVMFLAVLSILVITFINAVAFTKYPFAGFFYQPNLYVSFTERAQWEGMKNGITPLDRLEKINGKQIENGTQALKTVQRMPFDSSVDFSFQKKDGTARDVTVKLSKFTLNDLSVTFLLPFLIGLFFLVTGFAVFLLNPFKKLAFINFLSSLFITLFYSTVLDSNTTYWFYRLFALYPLVGATSVHFILTITASDFLKKHPITEFVPYVLAGALVGVQEYFLYTQYSATLIYMVSSIFLVGCVLLNFVYLIIYYITTQDIVSRRKTRFYIIALFFGTIIPSLWSITFAFGRPILSLDWAILLSVFYPIFTGYAITREDLFNIESIVRTSLEYLIFTGIVVAAYFIIVTITSMALQKYVASTPLVNTILTILVIVVSSPFRKRIQNFIDRIFYPERYDILEKLNEITTALSYVRDKRTLGAVLSKKISDAISLKSAGLIYTSKDGKTSFYSSKDSAMTIEISSYALLRMFPKPNVIEYVNDITESTPPRAMRKEIAELLKLHPQYFLPIGKENTRAVLVIGKKTSGISFLNDDVNFLKSLYPQIETAFVNAELHEQKAEQEKLAAIGEVASVIIHEIKNPLGIIKISSDTLRKRHVEDPKALEVLGFIEEEVSRINDTVTNFLDYAKPKHPIKKNYSVEELRAYLSNMRPEMEKDGHKLEINISDDIRSFVIDPDHLKQMLLNLLLNAKEATPSGSTIRVDVCLRDEHLEISVSDSGKGVSEEVGEKLFNPFYTTKEHGTGLGLSVTKQLARINGGDVKWDNRPEGGAIFTISLHSGENII